MSWNPLSMWKLFISFCILKKGIYDHYYDSLEFINVESINQLTDLKPEN